MNKLLRNQPGKTLTTVYLNTENYNKLKHILIDQGKSFSEWLSEVIEKFIKENHD